MMTLSIFQSFYGYFYGQIINNWNLFKKKRPPLYLKWGIWRSLFIVRQKYCLQIAVKSNPEITVRTQICQEKVPPCSWVCVCSSEDLSPVTVSGTKVLTMFNMTNLQSLWRPVERFVCSEIFLDRLFMGVVKQNLAVVKYMETTQSWSIQRRTRDSRLKSFWYWLWRNVLLLNLSRSDFKQNWDRFLLRENDLVPRHRVQPTHFIH